MKRTSLLALTVIVCVLMLASITSAATVSCTGVAAWSPNSVAYAAGALVTYNGSEYKCLQAHTSQAGWDPADVPALWSLVGTCSTGGATPTPTATAKPTATATATATAKPTATATATAKPTATATATAKPTATATATAKPTATATATAKPTATPTATATPTGGGGGTVTCTAPTWSSGTVYNTGNQVQYNGYLWQAAYYTQGNTPAPGIDYVWSAAGICGSIPGAYSGRMAAPYVDVTGPLFATATSQAPVKYMTLAFVISSSGCQASWAGSASLNIPAPGTTPPLASQISTFRSHGGDVVISFGGAAGTELALACSSASALQQQYQNVITQYNAKYIDFDIESSSTNDTTRQQVIAALQKANPGLVVSYTLQTEPSGINGLASTVLADAQAAGVNIGVVNVMAMDFGGSYDHGGQMGLDAQLSGWSLEDTLQNMYPSKSRAQVAAMVGVTPMIGTNDNEAEIFQVADANTLVQTALSNGWGRIAFWSVTRDTDCLNAGFTTTTPSPASGNCSGVTQSQFDYSKAFNAFNP